MNDRRRDTRSTERRTTDARVGPQGRRRRHIALIVHGVRAEFPGLRHLVEWMRAKGHTVRVRITWEPDDGAMFAREAVDAGADTIVACGGDGTVNEVLNYVQFHGPDLLATFRRKVSAAKDISRQEANSFIADYVGGLEGYTYLEGDVPVASGD